MWAEQLRGNTEFAPPAISESFIKKLSCEGFPLLDALDSPAGTFDQEKYRAYFTPYNHITQNGALGELHVPENLRNVPDNTKIVIIQAPFGNGHPRIADITASAYHVLGIAAEVRDLSMPTSWNDLLARFIGENLEYYFRESRAEGKKNGMAETVRELDRHRVVPPNIFTPFFSVWKMLDPANFSNTLIGNINGSLTPENTKQVLATLDFLFGPKLRHDLDRMDATHAIAVYPLLSHTLKQWGKPFITIGTDAYLDPAGWQPPLVVESSISKANHLRVFGNEYEQDIEVSFGFPAPLSSLIRVRELSRIRAEKMQTEPLTLFLAASGVATAQSGIFAEMMRENAPFLKSGEIKMVIQAGFGLEGIGLYRFLDRTATQLGVRNAVDLHWADTPEGAIHFAEAILAGETPLAIAVKGSEMARIALTLGIPHIVTGAIGNQEYMNVLLALLQGGAVSLLPNAHRQLMDFVDSPLFPSQLDYLKGEIRQVTEPARCTGLAEAIAKTRSYITQEKRGLTNCNMIVDTLSKLLSTKT